MLNTQQSEQLEKVLLTAQRQLLQNAQSSLEMSMDGASESGGDSIDQSSSEELLSTALRLRDREKKLLHKIRGAIDRLREGSIDECESCGEAIGFKRLLARPVTTLCISCKESEEEEERRSAERGGGVSEEWGSVAPAVEE